MAGDPAKAKVLMGEARDAVKAKRYDEAIEKLREASTHLDHPSIHFAKSRVYGYMLDLTAAEKALKKCEEFELPRKLRQAVDKQREAIGELKTKHGQLVVEVEPEEADILLVIGDEKLRFKGSADRWFTPGKVRVEVSKRGYAPAVRPATLEAGQTANIRVELRQLMGTIQLTVTGGLKGVKVLLDSKPVPIEGGKAAGDIAAFKAPPGAHEVVCVKSGKRDSQVLKVEVNKVVAVRCDKVGGGGPLPRAAMGWGAVGVGVLLAGLGSYHIGGYFDDATYAESNGLIASKDRAYGGTAFLVSGVALGLTSYLLWIREPSSAATVWPGVSPQDHGAVSRPLASAPF